MRKLQIIVLTDIQFRLLCAIYVRFVRGCRAASLFLLLNTNYLLPPFDVILSTMDAKDEVKERLSVEDVVGDYLELKRSGRNFKARSPWTSEKTASFMVSPEKQIWHDFSSGKGGDIFSFVMEMEGIDFREALELLARKAGVEIEQYKGNKEFTKLKDRLYKANRLAALYYHQTLVKNKPALDYVVQQRKFGKEVIGDFKLGYAPSTGDSLMKFLLSKKFTADELHSAGLMFRSNGRQGDMFRGRIMVPLNDPRGMSLGFTSRIMEDDPNAPKYMNTPKSPVYDKSRHVFGLELARDSIRSQDFAIVVEGNLDVLASHQAGIKNCVATAGTAMTTEHLKQLKRFSSNVRLAFDGDAAGIKATERAVTLAQEIDDLNLEIIDMPEGKDPDDIVRSDPEAWKQLVARSSYVLDWLFDHYEKQFDITSASGKKSMTDHVLLVLSRLKDPVEQEHYVAKLAKLTETPLEAMQRKLATVGSSKNSRPKKRIRSDIKDDKSKDKSIYQDTYLALNALYPGVRDSLKGVEKSMLIGQQRAQVFDHIQTLGKDKISNTLPKELQSLENYVKILSLRAEELYADWSASDRMVEAIGLARRVKEENVKNQKSTLTKQIADAEAEGDAEAATELLKKYHQLL